MPTFRSSDPRTSATSSTGSAPSGGGGSGVDGSGYAAAAGSYLASREANEARAEEAKKQRAWEASMSNTAYQRSIADMRKAGINPLSVYGGPASTPSTVAPQVESYGGAITSAIEAIRLKKEMAETDSRIALNSNQAVNQAAQARLNENTAKKVKAELPASATKGTIGKNVGDAIANGKTVMEGTAKTVYEYGKSLLGPSYKQLPIQTNPKKDYVTRPRPVK